jgi:hypothetical protein
VTTTEPVPSPATEAQSASDCHSLTPAPSPYASTDVRYETITAVPAMVTSCGLPPSRCCHWDTPGASGSEVFTQFHSFGHGLNTWVVARTMRATVANTVKPFHPGPLPEATLDTLTR